MKNWTVAACVLVLALAGIALGAVSRSDPKEFVVMTTQGDKIDGRITCHTIIVNSTNATPSLVTLRSHGLDFWSQYVERSQPVTIVLGPRASCDDLTLQAAPSGVVVSVW